MTSTQGTPLPHAPNLTPKQARILAYVATSEKPVGTWVTSGNGVPQELITAMLHCLEYGWLRVEINFRNLPYLQITDQGRQELISYVANSNR